MGWVPISLISVMSDVFRHEELCPVWPVDRMGRQRLPVLRTRLSNPDGCPTTGPCQHGLEDRALSDILLHPVPRVPDRHHYVRLGRKRTQACGEDVRAHRSPAHPDSRCVLAGGRPSMAGLLVDGSGSASAHPASTGNGGPSQQPFNKHLAHPSATGTGWVIPFCRIGG